MSREERQKIITDEFRANFDKIFGVKPKVAPDIDEAQANLKRIISKANTGVDET